MHVLRDREREREVLKPCIASVKSQYDYLLRYRSPWAWLSRGSYRCRVIQERYASAQEKGLG